MYKNKFAALRARMERKAAEVIEKNAKAKEAFYDSLIKELHLSNKADCSPFSDKCRRKRVSYCANKLRQ